MGKDDISSSGRNHELSDSSHILTVEPINVGTEKKKS